MTRTAKDITGQVFGRLTAIERASNKGGNIRWLFQCVCGKRTVARTDHVKSGATKSCGCLGIESKKRNRTKFKPTHGMSHTSEYYAWANMKCRCSLASHKQYQDYGGRGIEVCNRWKSFLNFFEDMGERPSSEHSLDRVDNEDGYFPENCRWATRTEQQRNTRANRYLTIYGRVKHISEWLHISGTNYSTATRRLHGGWTDKEAVFGRKVKLMKTARFLTIYGSRKRLAEWCHIAGIEYYTLMNRLRLGWPEKEAIFGRSANHKPKQRSQSRG